MCVMCKMPVTHGGELLALPHISVFICLRLSLPRLHSLTLCCAYVIRSGKHWAERKQQFLSQSLLWCFMPKSVAATFSFKGMRTVCFNHPVGSMGIFADLQLTSMFNVSKTPGGPGSPLWPWSPIGPIGPGSPVRPLSPWTPLSPGIPGSPCNNEAHTHQSFILFVFFLPWI